MNPKSNLESNTISETSNLSAREQSQMWEEKENTLKKVLDPIAFDDSAEAWKLRNSFLESVVDIKKELQGLERALQQRGYHMNDIGMFDKEMPSLEELDIRSDFYTKNFLMDKVLKTLALNLSSIASDESLIFRQKLFEMGTHISYLIESLESVYEENPKAAQLFDKFLIEWTKIHKVSIEDL